MFRYEPKISCYFVIVKISYIEFHFSDDDELCPVKTFVRHKRKLNPNCVLTDSDLGSFKTVMIDDSERISITAGDRIGW
jgi:hypothetical protein